MKEESRNPLVCANDVCMRACELKIFASPLNIMACCRSSLSGWKLKEFKASHFSVQRIFMLSVLWCLNTDSASDDAGMMECYTDAKESKLSKNDTLNATHTLYFSHTDMAECKYHGYASPSIKKEFGFLLSNHSSEYPLSYLPHPLR